MLIDKIFENISGETRDFLYPDAVFKIDGNPSEFFKSYNAKMSIPSRLPFQKIAIQFDDTVLLMFDNDSDGNNRVISATWCVRYNKKNFVSVVYDDEFEKTEDQIIRFVNLLYNPISLEISGLGMSKNDGPVLNINKLSSRERGCVYGMLKVTSRFLEILSCKNIIESEYKYSEKIQKKRIKKGKLPLFSYKELLIGGINIELNGAECCNGWLNRVHICRGHMKTFTSDKPLFGKHIGSYWFSPHVRGRNKSGIVLKKYKVSNENN